jgi:hypothetical protein
MRFKMKTELYGHEISTVELPEGYSQSELGSYETMIQGYKGEWLDFQKRSNTHEEAVADHNEGIRFVLKLIDGQTQRQKEKEGMIAELERDYKDGNLGLLDGLKKVSELEEESK